MSEEIDIWTEGRLGRIRLNRPRAINALSPGMIEAVTAALTGWRSDAAIGAVLIDGAGEKGFCAGGDVRAARSHVLDGRPEAADQYFAAEYRMNALIAGYAKPLVALSHGIVMGGGIGIAGHCGFRFTLPEARFAMPESAIGLFADVGVNAILAKAPLNRALLFLLSGISAGAADALSLGLADAVVRADRVEPLVSGIAAAAGAASPGEAIVRLMQAESVDAGEASFCAGADLLPPVNWARPADFVAAVGTVPELASLAALLGTRCPASLAATFHAQLMARRQMSVARTLEMDLRLAALMARRADFAEGVRAVLIDKDQQPRWSPATLDALDEAPILAAVEGT